jgi:hypothetical protein
VVGSNIYLGLEGELNLGGPSTVDPLTAEGTSCSTADFCDTIENQFSLDTLGRVRAIFGVAEDANSDSATDYLIGATFGAGVEVKATHNMIVRVEGIIDTYPTAVMANNLSASSSVDNGAGSTASGSLSYSGTATFADAMVRAALIWQF